ncbi:GIN domain-containing protein [Hyphococcus luteus]|nr:DUF2807 domain-containing protein [Marinicaulis flavus]
MYRPVIALSLAANLVALPAAAETKTYDLPEFESIDISTGLHLVAAAGGVQSVAVESDAGDFSELEIEVKDGVLKLSREWNRLRWHQKKNDYKIIVTAPKIDGIDASAGSYSTLSNIDAGRFTADLSSGSFVTVDGRGGDCVIDISSGANLEARALTCEKVNVDVSSGGHGEVSVLRVLVGEASSGGHMSVFGAPERVNIDRSSGGRIKLKAPVSASND